MSDSPHHSIANKDGDEPSIWARTPVNDPALPITEAPPSGGERSGRGYGLTAIISSACALVLGVVLPSFAAMLAAGAAVIAGIGMRRSTTSSTRKLARVGLIISLVVVVVAVAYTFYSVFMGYARWEQSQS